MLALFINKIGQTFLILNHLPKSASVKNRINYCTVACLRKLAAQSVIVWLPGLCRLERALEIETENFILQSLD